MRYVKIKYQLINYLRCPKFSAFQDKKKVKRLKHRITIDGLNLDKCIRVIKTDIRLCMLYRSLPPPLPPSPHPSIVLPLEISLRFATFPLLPVEWVTGQWYCFGRNYSKSYLVTNTEERTKLCFKARWWSRDLAAIVLCCCVETSSYYLLHNSLAWTIDLSTSRDATRSGEFPRSLYRSMPLARLRRPCIS